jgi:hypothetical protein
MSVTLLPVPGTALPQSNFQPTTAVQAFRQPALPKQARIGDLRDNGGVGFSVLGFRFWVFVKGCIGVMRFNQGAEILSAGGRMLLSATTVELGSHRGRAMGVIGRLARSWWPG